MVRKCSFLSCSLVFVFLFIACSRENPEEKFKSLMEKAKGFTTAEKWDEARISLMSASEIKPRDANVYYELAEVYVRQQQFDRAAETYRAAINYDPKHKMARLHLATLLLAARDFEQAEDHIKKLLADSPDDAEVQLLEDNLEAASPRKNIVGAKKIYEAILKKDENNVGAIAGLGGLALQENELKEAEEYFLRAAKIEGKNPTLKMVLADLYSRQGRLDEAQSIVETLIQEDPKNTGLRFGFGEFLLRRGLGDKATEQYEAIVKSDATRHDARDRLYDMYLVRKEVAKALALGTDLEKLKPGDAGTAYFLGRNAELEGKPEEALKLFQKALATLNGFAPAFRRAGLIEMAQGDERNGLQHLNQSVAIDPADVGARLALARKALTEQNVSLANEHVTQVLKRFPRQLGANVLRADIALLENQPEAARKVYQYLIDTFPESPSGYFKLGLLEEKLKNTDAAIAMYQKTLSLDSGVVLPAQRLVGMLVQKIGLEKTIEEMQKLHDKSVNSKPEFELIIGTLNLANGADANRLTKAREYLTKALEGRPSLIGAYFALGAIDSQQGDVNAAATNYEKLIAQNPKHIPSYMLLALARERQEKFAEAAETYRKVLEIAPRFGPAANNLAWLLADRLNGNLDEALKLAQTAREVLPNEGSVADTLGWVNFKRGSKAVALSTLKDAIELEKKNGDGKRINPEILFHVAQVHHALGDATQAKAALEEAMLQAGENHPLYKDLQNFQKTLG